MVKPSLSIEGLVCSERFSTQVTSRIINIIRVMKYSFNIRLSIDLLDCGSVSLSSPNIKGDKLIFMKYNVLIISIKC